MAKMVEFETEVKVTTRWRGVVRDDLAEGDVFFMSNGEFEELNLDVDDFHEGQWELVRGSFRELGPADGGPGRGLPLDPWALLNLLSTLAGLFEAAFSLTTGRVPLRLELFPEDETLRGELAYSDVGVMSVDALREHYGRGEVD